MSAATDLPLSIALFQAALWLEAAHQKGAFEREIADICMQAHDAIEEMEVRLASIDAKGSVLAGQGAMQWADQR